MKTNLLLLLFLISSTTFYAQIEGDAHELGLMASLSKNISVVYKKGTTKNLFRMSALFVGGNNRFDINENQSVHSFSIGATLGYERRIPIFKTLYAVLGIEGGLYYTGNFEWEKEFLSSTELERTTSTNSITPTINAVLGLNYALKDHWLFFAEVTPSFGIGYNITNTRTVYNIIPDNPFDEKRENINLNYGFNMNHVRLGIAYRFVAEGRKKKGQES